MSRSVVHPVRRLALTGLAVAALTTGTVAAGPAAALAAPPATALTPPAATALAAPPATALTPPAATAPAAPPATALTAPAVTARALAAEPAPHRAGPAARAARAARMRSYRIVAVARAQRGKPYRFGARGPNAFDCSGLSGFAYKQVRLRLPRTADAQYQGTRKISRAAARPGDLVFWVRGGHAYHVGIYAGGGRVWHAPKPGSRVKVATIWSPGETRYGRVGL